MALRATSVCAVARSWRRCNATTCSNGDSVASEDLAPIRWTYIPHYVPYKLGLKLQEHLVQQRADARAFLQEQPSTSPAGQASEAAERVQRAQAISETDTFLLLQHAPVYTEGRRGGEYAQTPEEEEGIRKRFAEIGADYEVTKRGGLITYHGPGQLVGYPILDLNAMELSTRCYVNRIQDAIQALLHAHPYSLKTVPPPDDHTGVWSDESHKITSIGIQVRHRITSHGFALNVETDVLKWFGWIVACGIKGKGMTCMQREVALRIQQGASLRVEEPAEQLLKSSSSAPFAPGVGPGMGIVDKPIALGPEAQAVTVDSVVPHLVEHWGALFKRRMRESSTGEFKYEADPNGRLSKVIVDGHELV